MTDCFFGVWERQWRKIVLVLASLLVLVAGFFVFTDNVHATEASLINGRMTFDGRSFSGPLTATNDRIVPMGSIYFLEDVGESATQRIIIYSPDEITVGSEVTVAVWEFAAPNTYVRELSSSRVVVGDGSDILGDGTDMSCTAQIGAIGWIICPTLSFLAMVTDALFEFLQQFLVVEPFLADNSSPIFLTWQHMRNFANIAFAIFMLVVILSQVTSIGISNYGIKKMLPRIIAAAVLVNLSWVICAIAVDASNILGYQIRGLFDTVQESVAAAAGGTYISAVPSMTDLLIAVTGGVGIVAGLAMVGGIGGALFLLIPVLFSAVIAVVAALVTLAARQALIVLLVIVSPLAFVAYLLPNTENLFVKWRTLFMKLLVLFPAFALLFGASRLAGWAIVTSASSMMMVLLGVAVTVIPLIFVPMLMKLSGSLLNTVNAMARKPFGRAQGAVTNWSAERSNIQRRELAAKGQQGRWYNQMPHTTLAGRFEYNREQRNRRLARAESDAKSLAQRRANEANWKNREKGVLSKAGEAEYRSKLYKYQADTEASAWSNDMGQMSDMVAGASARRTKDARNQMTNTFMRNTLETSRTKNINVGDAAYASSEISKAYNEHLQNNDSELWRQIAAADGGRGQEGMLNIVAAAAQMKDNEDRRILEETQTMMGKATQGNLSAQLKELKEGYKNKDGFRMRAAMNLIVSTNGSYGIGKMEETFREEIFNPANSADYADALADADINGIAANHLANSSAIANDIRKKAGLLWMWGNNHSGKDDNGKYNFGDAGRLIAYTNLDPSGYVNDVTATKNVMEVLSGPGDVIAQGANTIKHLIRSGALSPEQALLEIETGGSNPDKFDLTKDKLIALAEHAGLVAPTATDAAKYAAAINHMKRFRPGGVSGTP